MEDKKNGKVYLFTLLDPIIKFSKNVKQHNDYQFDIENVKSIEDLTFDITFDFQYSNLKKVKIPIIKGKPFGKDLPIQRMYIMK